MARREKGVHIPLDFDTALSALLRVKPPKKAAPQKPTPSKAPAKPPKLKAVKGAKKSPKRKK